MLNNPVIILSQSLEDTVQLSTVQISPENISRFQSGAKIDKIEPLQFDLMKDGNLANLLLRFTPIAIKSDASGLSSIRIRGTSPNHTSVNFGGIDLNSISLGQTNIINIPMELFDEIEIQYGSSSAVNGSGSIGGALHLGLKNNLINGFRAEISTSQGSFGEQLYGTKLYFGNGKWETVTRIYYYYKTNNFKFLNTSIKDFGTGVIGVEDIQHQANVNNKGILQEINYYFSRKEYLKLMVWFEDDWHCVQQNQATNYYTPNLKETYQDKNVRAWASYDNFKKLLKFHIGAGYVFDNGIFNQTSEPIKSQRLLSDAYLEYDRSNSSIKTGLKASRIYPEVFAYSELKHEDKLDLYLSLSHQFYKKLKMTLNLRQGFITDFKVPFVPALGFSYMLIYNEKNVLKLTGNIAKSYREPTFNDRFWQPGGNPELEPENGMNYELGLNYSHSKEKVKTSMKINAFFMDIDNWILWKNGGAYWYAENVQRVQSKGIEAKWDIKYEIGNLEITNSINYAYTNAQRIESIVENSSMGRQLEYVPIHSAVAYANATYKKFSFSVDGNFTSEQFTDETDRSILDPRFLLNIASAYHFEFKSKNKFRIQAMINNILNKNYQSSLNFAMPGINYKISFNYHFK